MDICHYFLTLNRIKTMNGLVEKIIARIFKNENND